MGIQLIMTTVYAVAAASGCSWAHPGANPYRGDPVAALADFSLGDDTRRKLAALMRAHRYTDVATITRDSIAGAAAYDDLREMHSGRGQVCHGSVDRSAWSDTRRERGLVYCAGDACVIVPTICNNVSLVSRKPEQEAAALPADDEPIDISPSAGPPAAVPAPADAAPPSQDAFAAGAPPDSFAGAVPPTTDVPSGSDSGGGIGGGSGTSVGAPIGGAPIGGQGDTGGGCCIVGTAPTGSTGSSGSSGGSGGSPGGPGSPGSSIPAIPEPPAWLLLCAGLVALFGHRRTTRRRAP